MGPGRTRGLSHLHQNDVGDRLRFFLLERSRVMIDIAPVRLAVQRIQHRKKIVRRDPSELGIDNT